MKPNSDVRNTIKRLGLCTWQVADRLRIHENTLYRRLRKELSQEEKEIILKVIQDIADEPYIEAKRA